MRWGDELGLSKRVIDVITNTTAKGDLTEKSRPSEDRRFREGRCKVSGFEEKGHKPKSTGRDEEADSLLEPPEASGHRAC